ncbi:MAG: energy transducer TonB [Planctomycetes bacterium]|nr:energy transducer TonB [Planctomycetota bacterium]
MKFGLLLGLGAAFLMHAAFILFGGLIFPKEELTSGSVQAVDLLGEVEDVKKETKPEEPQEKEPEELETSDEAPPDSADVLKSLDTPPSNDAPALEAASLSAIEAALSGQAGGGDFAEAIGFGSGGRIGGTGVAGGSQEKLEEAFSLAELDQKPRPIVQTSPTFPAEMRGKKVEGVVSVIFVVDASGKVENPRVEKSSHAAFEAPALAAIRKWKFEPGLRAGQRVASKMRVSIRFPAS